MLKKKKRSPTNVAIVTTPPHWKNVNKNIQISKVQLGNDPRWI